MITAEELTSVGAAPYIQLIEMIKKFAISDDAKLSCAPAGCDEIRIPLLEIYKIFGLRLDKPAGLLVRDGILKNFIANSNNFEPYEILPISHPDYPKDDCCLMYRRKGIGDKELDKYIADLIEIGENGTAFSATKTKMVTGDVAEIHSVEATKPNMLKPESGAPRHLIHKDARGDFYYDGRRIEMSQETIYYKVFDALYELGAHDGSVSYGEIEKHLIKLRVKAALNDKKRSKRIINAISERQGLFKFAKINGKKIPNVTKNGQELVEVVKGIGLKLNNPIV